MAAEPLPASPSARRLLAAAAILLATALAARWLWAFWTPRCNEACPRPVVLAMHGTFAAMGLSAFALGALTAAGRLGTKQAAAAYAAAAAAFAAWIAWLS